MGYADTLTPALTHRMGEGARRAGEGRVSSIRPSREYACGQAVQRLPPQQQAWPGLRAVTSTLAMKSAAWVPAGRAAAIFW